MKCPNSFINPALQNLHNPINVPLNGPLKSVPLIVQQQIGYTNNQP